jgi:hypothetical protein
MNDFTSKIEALELRWMRAWVNADRPEMKALASRDFIFLFASTTPTILDRASWLDGALGRLRCDSFRFGNGYVRRHGAYAVFAAPVELKATLDGRALFEGAFVTDVWRRSKVRRRWQLVERTLVPTDSIAELPSAVRSLQLWR